MMASNHMKYMDKWNAMQILKWLLAKQCNNMAQTYERQDMLKIPSKAQLSCLLKGE